MEKVISDSWMEELRTGTQKKQRTNKHHKNKNPNCPDSGVVWKSLFVVLLYFGMVKNMRFKPQTLF